MGFNAGDCSAYVGGVAVGVYATAVYLIASGLELSWIIELEENTFPLALYVLTTVYFCFMFSACFLLIGLLLHKRRYLIVWLAVTSALFFVEGGLVLYISLYQWGLRSSRGLAEFIFYVCRAVLNILSIVCIHWLQSAWQKEADVLKRLQTLQVGSLFSDMNSTTPKSESESGKVQVSHKILYTTSCSQESELVYLSETRNAANQFQTDRSAAEMANTDEPQVQTPFDDNSFCAEPGYSEFDASSFNEFLVWKLGQTQKSPQWMYTDSPQSDIIQTSDKKQTLFQNSNFDDNISLCSTNSLQRRTVKSKTLEDMRRVQSLGDIYGTKQLFTEPSEKQIDAVNKIVFGEEESDSSHSIRDVAL